MFGWLGGKREMAETRSLGARAVKQIADTWMVDRDRIEWVDNGFGWWPGSFRVRVRHQGGSDPDRWRVSVATDFVEDAPVGDRRFTHLTSSIGLFASSYSYVYLTERMAARLKARRSNSLYLAGPDGLAPSVSGQGGDPAADRCRDQGEDTGRAIRRQTSFCTRGKDQVRI